MRLFLDSSVLLAASGSASGASREVFNRAISQGWILIMDDVLTIDRPVVFDVGKDRPILFSALAWADVLLTLEVFPLLNQRFRW